MSATKTPSLVWLGRWQILLSALSFSPPFLPTLFPSKPAVALTRTLGGAVRAVPWEQRQSALLGASLLVNTTSLGMSGQAPLDLTLEQLEPQAVVSDLVYGPLETPLLVAARARGNPVVGGLGMLLNQARPAFHAWFGVMPQITPALRSMVEASL